MIIDNISKKISYKIYNNKNNDISYEVIKYGVDIFLNTISVCLIVTVIGILTQNLIEILTAAISFAMLRQFSGGYHIKNSELCIIVSSLILILIPYISIYLEEYVIYMNIISIIMVAFYAPSIRWTSNINGKKKIISKIISIILVGLNFFLASSTISVVMLIQSITLIEKRGEKNETKTI